MKILLVAINAKYIHSNLAIRSLRAYAKEYVDNVEIAEFTINNYSHQIIKEIYKKSADVIAFSTYIWNVNMVYEVAEEIKKLMPQTKIWLGGPQVSYDGDKVLLENTFLTGVMCGEGEAIFKDLAAYYIGKKGSLKDIDGIIYRENEEILINPARKLLNMDEVPFVYEDLSDFEDKIIYYESSRGCPYSCSYCISSIDKSVRFRSIELVKKELQFFLDKKVTQVKFVDRTFNCKREHTMAVWKYILENDNGVTNFHFEIAANLLSDEEIELISRMRPGLIQLEIGVQSVNEKTIEEIDRKISFEKISEVCKKVSKGQNIHQHLDLIAGLPYEDYESFKNSFNKVFELEPQQLQLGFLKVLKGSNMERRALQYELKYLTNAPYEVLSTKWISYDEILKLKNVEEMVETYYNSGQYPNTIKYLLTKFDTPFDMFEALSKYYEDNNLFDVKHSRISRYTYLYNFMTERDRKNTQMYAGILTFDLYLREKLKTRPFFAPDLSDKKKEIRELYDTVFADYKGKMSHLEYVSIGTNPKWCLFDYEDRDPLTGNGKVIVWQSEQMKF